MKLKQVANKKLPELGSWVFGKEYSDGNKKKLDFDHLTGEESVAFLVLARVEDVSYNTITLKFYLDRTDKYIILTKSLKKYWVLKNSEDPNDYLGVDTNYFSNIGGNMKITKSELISFAESLTEALETVAEKIEAIEDIINGDSPAVVDEVIEDDDYVEDDDDEDMVDEDEYDEDNYVDEDEEDEVEEEDADDEDVDDDDSESTEEDFSKRYSKVKNFLTL